MSIVVALGGNALSVRGAKLTGESQRARIRQAAASLTQILDAGHEVVITHGNGPQVGYLALQGVAVICAGGGGTPVTRRDDGTMIGVEVVIWSLIPILPHGFGWT